MSRRFLNREFLAVSVPVFVATVLVLEAVDAPIVFAVAVGVVLDMGLDPLLDVFLDLHEKRLQK